MEYYKTELEPNFIWCIWHTFHDMHPLSKMGYLKILEKEAPQILNLEVCCIMGVENFYVKWGRGEGGQGSG